MNPVRPPEAGRYPIDTGAVVLVADGAGRWLVEVNGVPSSYVDLDDATNLVFEYVQWLGALVDTLADPGLPLRVAHLGGAGCTLPRYVSATRPGSTQVVFEPDAALVELARTRLGVRGPGSARLRVRDGASGVARLRADSRDLVVRDAFAGDVVPPDLSTPAFAEDVRRVLAPGGVYVANLADGPGLALAYEEAAVLSGTFAEVVIVTEPAIFRGRRYGNVLLLAGDPLPPLDSWERRLASGPAPARLERGGRRDRRVRTGRPSS